MIRRIIQIDKEKCNGCGACAAACHEGAIAMADGKAQLMRDDYCDGLGDCLPACPTHAITFVEREAAAYDEGAVAENKKQKQKQGPNQSQTLKQSQAHHGHPLPGGCPGSMARKIRQAPTAEMEEESGRRGRAVSRLSQWPVQIRLVPVKAPYFENAKLLIAADCTAYAYAAFHEEFLKGRIALIGCPKLDDTDYSEKLTEIIKSNEIRSVTIVRMEVPCCKGLENAAKKAILDSGKFLPWQVVTISIDGKILDD